MLMSPKRWLYYVYLTIYILLLALRPKPSNNFVRTIILLELAQTCICEVKIRCKAKDEKKSLSWKTFQVISNMFVVILKLVIDM